MVFGTFQRLLIKSTLFINSNNFRKTGTVYLQSQRMFVTVSSQLFRNSSKLDCNLFLSNPQFCTERRATGSKGIQENISPLQMKKRPLRKKKSFMDEEDVQVPGVNNSYLLFLKFVNYLFNLVILSLKFTSYLI